MGRKGGRGKKHSSSHEETESGGDDEKIPAQKRRGRPQKLQKDHDSSDWEGTENVEEEEDNDNGDSGTAKDTNSEKYKRKKRNFSQKLDSVEEVIAVGMKVKVSTEDNVEDDDSGKTNGFRHNGSRRKSKPRRAAEVGTVEWSMDESKY